MVGLAFERNTAAKEQAENKSTDAIAAIKKAYYNDILNVNIEDMFHYTFNYIGVLTGPYSSYRTFRDYFTARYWQHVNCERVLFHRLKWVVVYAALFLSCSYYWPIHVSRPCLSVTGLTRIIVSLLSVLSTPSLTNSTSNDPSCTDCGTCGPRSSTSGCASISA